MKHGKQATSHKQGENMKAQTKEQYRKAWYGNVNELSILSFAFSVNDPEFLEIYEMQKRLHELVKLAAEKLDIPEK